MAVDNQEVWDGLTEIIVDETGLDAAEVTGAKSFADDLLIDSLSMMTIVTLAEDKFGVEIPDDQVKDLVTVQDAVDFIAAQAAA
ncbi:MAG: acyl carrier protein [Bifidobacteriaceae bacterium]|jgi:acyl carrier protein|nr:acyl carrier protein [Bifidobacteriaceae bacterium]